MTPGPKHAVEESLDRLEFMSTAMELYDAVDVLMDAGITHATPEMLKAISKAMGRMDVAVEVQGRPS